MKFDNIFDALKWVTDKGGRRIVLSSNNDIFIFTTISKNNLHSPYDIDFLLNNSRDEKWQADIEKVPFNDLFPKWLDGVEIYFDLFGEEHLIASSNFNEAFSKHHVGIYEMSKDDFRQPIFYTKE